MWATFLIALREGLEAALIVGLLLGVLHRLGQGRWRGVVWAGVGVAVVLSVLAGLLLNAVGVVLEGPASSYNTRGIRTRRV
jgi:high-affinity iron transporter